MSLEFYFVLRVSCYCIVWGGVKIVVVIEYLTQNMASISREPDGRAVW
jgi:hypothetical protein